MAERVGSYRWRILAERCRRIDLGYLDPRAIRIDEWTGRESEGILVVPRAGEMLYRLRKADAMGAAR